MPQTARQALQAMRHAGRRSPEGIPTAPVLTSSALLALSADALLVSPALALRVFSQG